MVYITKVSIEKPGVDVLQEWLLGTTPELETCLADPRVISVQHFRAMDVNNRFYAEIHTTFESKSSYDEWLEAHPQYPALKAALLEYAEKMGISCDIQYPYVDQHDDEYWINNPTTSKFNKDNLAEFVTVAQILSES